RALGAMARVRGGAAAAVVVVATLRHRRFRLLGGLAVAAVVAAAAAAGIFYEFGGPHPAAVARNLARSSWLASAAFPWPALIAAAAAGIVPAPPRLSRPARRAGGPSPLA